MAEQNPDIVIYGAGIAGLWLLNRLRSMGYDALLLECNAVGGDQTIASQGIIHSGLKYALAGKVNKLAQSISAMPERWRVAMKSELSGAKIAATSQQLLIPKSFIGGITKVITTKALGDSVREITEWPEHIQSSGFNGTLIDMNEMVLDIPSVIQALANRHESAIRKSDQNISGKIGIYTAAQGNEHMAHLHGHDKGLKTQKRPLLMGMMKNAPFPLYAHLVGTSEKPVATITTHTAQDGSLIWYVGGGVAERAKDSEPEALYADVKKALIKYMPNLDLTYAQWACLPIDRIEGQSETDGWMPDTPVVHAAENALYAWPTKLTFAPLLADKIIDMLENKNIRPSGQQTDWSFLPPAPYAIAPWDKASWS